MDEQQLEYILVHELVHIRRLDGLVQLLAHAVAMVHWFNPLVRVACRFVESCRELSCDRQVLIAMAQWNSGPLERLYGKTILDIAERAKERTHVKSAFLGGFLNDDQNLMRERIAMLIGRKSPKRWSGILGGICLLLMISVGYTTAQTVPPETPLTQLTPTLNLPASTVQPNVTSRTDGQTELFTEIHTIQGESMGLANGGKELLKQFSVSRPEVCQIVWSNQEVKLKAVGVGTTTIQYAQDDGEKYRYEVVVFPKRPREVKLVRGTTERLTFDEKIPELMVGNPDVIRATPVSPTEILVTAVDMGISSLTVTQVEGDPIDLSIQVVPETRGLEETIAKAFPGSDVKVEATDAAIVLSGFAMENQIPGISKLVKDGCKMPTVNQIQRAEPIAIQIEVFEVDKKKLLELGADFSAITDREVYSMSDLMSDDRVENQPKTIALEVLDEKSQALKAVVQGFAERNIAKLLDRPVLVANNNRPADFLSGGEIPIATIDENGAKSIQFRPFGTILQLLPQLEGEGSLILETRAELSELDPELDNVDGVPGFRVRRINTALQMKLGQTVMMVGDYRREPDDAEVETVIFITPRLINSN
jgi:Flp pilus assembly secretin CpaC